MPCLKVVICPGFCRGTTVYAHCCRAINRHAPLHSQKCTGLGGKFRGYPTFVKHFKLRPPNLDSFSI